MLIAPDGTKLRHKTLVETARDTMQVIIDAEAFFTNLGLVYDLRCVECARSGDLEGAYCQGSVNDDCTAFTVECGCSTRVAHGAFTVPPEPAVPHPRAPLPDGSKRREPFTHAQMATITAFETVLQSLKLQYLMRCLRCRLNGEPADGVYGVRDKTEFVMECACTKRVAPNVMVKVN